MNIQDLKPLEEGVPIHDVLRTTPPLDDVPQAPLWMWAGIALVDLILWALIIAVGYGMVTVIAGWM
jgi:hypothetical protein